MRRTALAVVFFVVGVAYGQSVQTPNHPDYVPDEQTAKRIAEAVLVARFGEKEVKARMPLLVSNNGDIWKVQVAGLPADRGKKGGSFAVFIKVHDGCVAVFEHLK